MAYTLAWLIVLLHMLLGGFLLPKRKYPTHTLPLCPIPAVLRLKGLKLELCDGLHSRLAHVPASYAAGRVPTAKA